MNWHNKNQFGALCILTPMEDQNTSHQLSHIDTESRTWPFKAKRAMQSPVTLSDSLTAVHVRDHISGGPGKTVANFYPTVKISTMFNRFDTIPPYGVSRMHGDQTQRIVVMVVSILCVRDGTGSATLTRDPTRPGRLVTRDPTRDASDPW